MARYTGPKCRLCRREGVKLFLKGVRCESPKCAMLRRQQAPGQHGNRRKRGPSDYGLQLREKQKAKRIYGVMERQFRRYVKMAQKHTGQTGEYLLQTLERRLDNVVYRLGMAHSRAHARQLVRQQKVLVNDKVVKSPSFGVSTGDTVSFRDKNLEVVRDIKPPMWLKFNKKDKTGSVGELPKREDTAEPINEQLVVEFYSR